MTAHPRNGVDLLGSSIAAALEREPARGRCSNCGDEFVVLRSTVAASFVCLGCERRAAAGPPLDPAQELERRLLETGVPPRYTGGTRESWLARFERSWPLRPSWRLASSVIVHGPPGTGKTGMGALLLAEHLAAGGEGLWVTEDALTQAQQAATAAERSRQSELQHLITANYELLRRVERAGLLVFDGLFDRAKGDRLRVAPWALEIAGRVVAQRYDWRRTTIVTTNFSPRDLEGVSPSLASRLSEGLRVPLRGEDRRLSSFPVVKAHLE